MLFLSKKQDWLGNIRGDVLAGLVVALALIPEAIAFSIIAGVDPKVGLYASFCIAVITAFVGGRPGMISAATEQWLQPVTDKLTNIGGIEIISKILLGKPEQVLCEYQDKHAIDMVVMGAFSHTRMHDLLLGSFTAKMLMHSQKPLLLLR